mmetsp:Transcript_25235/g.39757  ORF Transcript_25235/g.39757 Transcript_25235/m.39757 type:complete len:212 (-) Transcript_25235:790-1425(-)
MIFVLIIMSTSRKVTGHGGCHTRYSNLMYPTTAPAIVLTLAHSSSTFSSITVSPLRTQAREASHAASTRACVFVLRSKVTVVPSLRRTTFSAGVQSWRYWRLIQPTVASPSVVLTCAQPPSACSTPTAAPSATHLCDATHTSPVRASLFTQRSMVDVAWEGCRHTHCSCTGSGAAAAAASSSDEVQPKSSRSARLHGGGGAFAGGAAGRYP